MKRKHGHILATAPQLAQAPACRLGSVARAAVADGAYVQSLQDASKVHPAHGERDAHRIFQKYWLSLRVPISDLMVGPFDGGDLVSIPHYKARHLKASHGCLFFLSGEIKLSSVAHQLVLIFLFQPSCLPIRFKTWSSTCCRSTQRICWVENVLWKALAGAKSFGICSRHTSRTMLSTYITKTIPE